MLLGSLLLLAVAGALHAIAHSIIKAARDKVAFNWWMLGASTIVGAPALLFSSLPKDASAWPFLLASGLVEAAYFLTLSNAYTLGELSSVYPIARGSGPLFTLLWSVSFLGERPTAPGVVGILLVVAGLYFVNLPSIREWRKPIANLRNAATLWALATGLLISGYTTIDKVGVRYLDPVAYLYFTLSVAWLALAPQWLLARRRAALVAEIARAGSNGRRAIDPLACLRVGASAALGFAAYVLVLAALRVSPASYVAPVREIGVVIGAWIGVVFLRERGGAIRVLAAALVVCGVLVIAFLG
jgi:uncharacterized membrane protein